MDISPIVPIYEAIKATMTLADVVLFAFFLFLIVKSWKYKPVFHAEQETEKVYTLGNAVLHERWTSIVMRSRINSQESMKLAIMDADNMVDEILKRMGLEGEHMADRLENLSIDDFQSLNRVWDAHKLRNRIVHEHGTSVTQEDAFRAMDGYGSFLKEIGVIEQK